MSSKKKSDSKKSGKGQQPEVDEAENNEDAWVFDSLVGFLRGPVWNVPVLTFIEHKSLSESISRFF